MKKALILSLVLATIGCTGILGGAKVDPAFVPCFSCQILPQDQQAACIKAFCPADATPAPTVTSAAQPSPTATATPAPTATTPAGTSRPPVVTKVNGCQVPDPGTGECGFTLFFSCPGCTRNRNWPCDQGHAHWKAIGEETCRALDDIGDSVCGSCSWVLANEPGSDAAAMCVGVCTASIPNIARVWDATCASVGGSFVRVTSGNIAIKPGRNCYQAFLSGAGTYEVVLPAGAKGCVDPADYIGDDSPVYSGGGCPHGEIVLTGRDLVQGPFSLNR